MVATLVKGEGLEMVLDGGRGHVVERASECEVVVLEVCCITVFGTVAGIGQGENSLVEPRRMVSPWPRMTADFPSSRTPLRRIPLDEQSCNITTVSSVSVINCRNGSRSVPDECA